MHQKIRKLPTNREKEQAGREKPVAAKILPFSYFCGSLYPPIGLPLRCNVFRPIKEHSHEVHLHDDLHGDFWSHSCRYHNLFRVRDPDQPAAPNCSAFDSQYQRSRARYADQPFASNSSAMHRRLQRCRAGYAHQPAAPNSPAMHRRLQRSHARHTNQPAAPNSSAMHRRLQRGRA